jgi:predicted acylesterase/phospholipase RssA
MAMTVHETKDDRIRARVEEMASEDFCYPGRAELDGRECDLVMKGGITSGIVYPLAACELARHYRFRSIGGSSAGAVGAVMIAAAEHGRDTGGFGRLAEIPIKLGPKLGDLFTAGPSTATALEVLKGWLQPGRSPWRRVGGVIRTLVRAQRRAFVLALVVVLLVGIGGSLGAAGLPHTSGDWFRLAAVIALLALPVAVGAALLVAAATEVQASRVNLARQGFGICIGSDGPRARSNVDAEPGPFTDWMAAEIDRVAGVEGPLTIGDLRGPDRDDPDVELQVMTTNLTLGRPQTFPFPDRTYLFDPKELEDYFPPKVMARLLRDQRPARTEDGRRVVGDDETRPLVWLPPADDLPIVVAARLSLSFPGLISAVPLWLVDETEDVGTADESSHIAKRCWMTDGGLTANFPVHFFDSPFPARPTFAIDLQGYPERHPDQDVFFRGSERGGMQAHFRPITSVHAFGAGLLDTMQYWADNAQATLPGYRDRIVQVRLRPDEGGMNLQMPEEVVNRAAEKGRQAAELIVERFDFDDHRWVRYLTLVAQLQDTVDRMAGRWVAEGPGGAPGYHDLVVNRSKPHPFARSETWRRDAAVRTGTLLSFASEETCSPDFLTKAPKPDPALRITPRF